MAAATFPVMVHEYEIAAKPGRFAYAYEFVFPGTVSAPSSAPDPPRKNALIIIGGLGGGPHTLRYPRTIAKRLEADASQLGFSVFEPRLRTSFSGFGYGSLAGDVTDLGALVRYLRGIGKEKVVLMGHSTGCQDCMEYTNHEKYQNSPVDGFILQGSCSDRESLAVFMDEEDLAAGVDHAKQLIKDGKPSEIMPKAMLPSFYSTPVTAYRWHSLAGLGGDDDYFSSDLPDDKVAAIWGRVRSPLLIVPSAEDEFVPPSVDFQKLVAKWKSFCRPGIASDLSAEIPGANHGVDQEKSQEWLADRVATFLGRLLRG